MGERPLHPGRARSAARTSILFALVAIVAAAMISGPQRSPGSAALRAGERGRAIPGERGTVDKASPATPLKGNPPRSTVRSRPRVMHLTKARTVVFDVRKLHGKVIKRERPEHPAPGEAGDEAVEGETGEGGAAADADAAVTAPDAIASVATAAPAPSISFDGLDFATWGAGHPPDANGDVGPTYYIQVVNTSIGIFNKSTGARVAAFTFNAFMSQGLFGNLCDTDNFGDPVVLYDSFEDRWFITDFAFKLDALRNVNPQQVFQCVAVSKTGDPVSGGWSFYSILAPGGLDDYPKFGVWPDGIYMSANMFGYAAGASYIGPHVWAIDKAEMYAGAPSVPVVDFAGPSSDFTLLPGNARLQTGTPPPGAPEYFVSTEMFLNALTVYKLHVDWDAVSTSTFTGPDTQLEPNCWPNQFPANASTPANTADVLGIRAMAQAQYTNIGGTESIWVDHTVQRNVSATPTNCNAATGGNATVRWYQLNVTGGTVAPNVIQGATFDPEGANTFFRFMPSLAVDRAGDMAMGYSKSSATTNPQIKYAGRLAGDSAGTLGQAEQTLIDGTGAQSGNCGGSACIRWGDYSGMALAPDGCTFWMTNEYYATTGLNDLTRIGSFAYPSCTPVGDGAISGTVTDGSTPIAGATVSLGSRTAVTNGSGAYSFTVPAGTYPSISAAAVGFDASPSSAIVVPDGGTASRNFTLSAAAQSGCLVDDTQGEFQRGVPANCDLAATPNSVVLADPTFIDQQNQTVSPSGFGISATAWAGQTFTPATTGRLVRGDLELFCASCSATSPNITVSIRNTTGSPPLPTGPDLATATLPGFNDGGAGGMKSVTFGSPATVTAGVRYAIIFRLAAPFASGTVAYTCSCATAGFSDSNPYTSGQRVTSPNNGSTWTADTTVGGRDLHFAIYQNNGFASSGTFVSSLKDANPASGRTPTWTTLSFTATEPAGTDVKFQVAGGDDVDGPFDFVGPDGTPGTFFTTSGADLSQFDGFRYLRYKAFLSTGDGSVTPTLSSVSVCFQDVSSVSVASIQVAVPKKATAGTPFTIQASALDADGHVLTGYSDPAASVTDAAGALPEGTTIAFVNGVAQAQLTIPVAVKGDTLSVTSGGVTGTSAAINVLGPLDHIKVKVTGPFVVGTPYAVAATAYDAAGNVLTTYKGSATASDLAGASGSGTFAKGKLTLNLTPTTAKRGDVATVVSGGVTGVSGKFRVLAS